jgi:hypothetical protein
MMYTIKELTFILYNNRSVSGVVKNFLPKLNPLLLNQVEDYLSVSKEKFEVNETQVQVNLKEFNLYREDVVVTPDDLLSLSDDIKSKVGFFSDEERIFLEKRGINEEIIKKWNLLGLSNIKSRRDLEIIGATSHPILTKILEDGIESGGILIPLFDDSGKLKNITNRKINSHKSLKYGLACPDISVWGIEGIKPNSEISICEGLFDMMALVEMCEKGVISCSSAMWSGPQLLQVIKKRPSSIKIYSDGDMVGQRTSFILKDFFEKWGITTKIFKSELAKDPSEHYFEMGMLLTDFVEVTKFEKCIQSNKFDFVDYLKNRNY